MNLFKWFKQAREKMKKGYTYEDTYDIQYWFLHTIPGMLDEMAEAKYLGAPGHLVAEFEDKYPDIPKDEADEMAFDYWRNYIKKMAYLFREAEEPTEQKNEYEEAWWEDFMNSDKLDFNDKDRTPEQKELEEKWLNREIEIDNYKVERLNEALKMFSDSFLDLWW